MVKITNSIIFSVFFFLSFLTYSVAQCPTGWYAPKTFGVNLDGCIYLNNNKSATYSWAYAQAKCKEIDVRSSLAYFSNQEKFKQFNGMTGMIATLVGKITVWLGGYQRQSDGQWYFLDGNPITSGFWQSGHPEPSPTTPQRCLGIRIGYDDTGVVDFSCQTDNVFACYLIDPTIAAVTTSNVKADGKGLASPATSCPAKWLPAGSYCYLFNETKAMLDPSYGTAFCQSIDPRSTLPQFTYESDWTYFMDFIEDNLPNAEHENILLAAKQNSAKSYSNPDGTFSFSRWYTGQPNGGGCVFSSDLNGYDWNTTDCTTPGYVICQLNSSLSMTGLTLGTYAPPPSRAAANGQVTAKQVQVNTPPACSPSARASWIILFMAILSEVYLIMFHHNAYQNLTLF